MAGRRLDAEEQALWTRVVAGVRPLRSRAAPAAAVADLAPPAARLPATLPPRPASVARPIRAAVPGETLDGSWDRRLARGLTAPDRIVDLHGHTLASAHGALDHALERAIGEGARLLLVVTGRPPRRDGTDGPRRGLIRAAIGDWLAGSRHAARIAAVRNAHPRHGGAGALYVVLRRRRDG